MSNGLAFHLRGPSSKLEGGGGGGAENNNRQIYAFG